VPVLERIAWSQFILFGEQNCPSAVQGSPLVTLWPLLNQVHLTVSPTEIFAVEGVNEKPSCPTATSKTWPVPDGIPLTTVRPFRSTTWMMWTSVCFSSAIIMGFSPDAVCDEKGSANIAASQNVSGTTALDRFMVLLLVLCVSVCGFP
jgi:hypothetical protein